MTATDGITTIPGGITTDELCCLTLIKRLLLSRESDSDVFLHLRGEGVKKRSKGYKQYSKCCIGQKLILCS